MISCNVYLNTSLSGRSSNYKLEMKCIQHTYTVYTMHVRTCITRNHSVCGAPYEMIPFHICNVWVLIYAVCRISLSIGTICMAIRWYEAQSVYAGIHKSLSYQAYMNWQDMHTHTAEDSFHRTCMYFYITLSPKFTHYHPHPSSRCTCLPVLRTIKLTGSIFCYLNCKEVYS